MPYNVFEKREAPIGGSARDLVPVTPHDTNDLDEVAVALLITTGGTITFISERGVTRGPITVEDKTTLPVGVRRVLATGTTATGIHAFVL
jgi:hypothetical protein